MPDKGLFVVDTSDLFAGLEGASTGDRKSLDRVCIHLQVPTESLHNAGNDAYVSLPYHLLNATLTRCFSTHSRPWCLWQPGILSIYKGKNVGQIGLDCIASRSLSSHTKRTATTQTKKELFHQSQGITPRSYQLLLSKRRNLGYPMYQTLYLNRLLVVRTAVVSSL